MSIKKPECKYCTSGVNSGDNVYFYSNIIDGADGDSLEYVFGNGKEYKSYAKDKTFVYLNGKKMEGADPSTFPSTFGKVDESFSSAFVSDGKNIFCRGLMLEGSDLKTFEIIDSKDAYPGTCTKDKNNIYYNCRKIEDADPETFMFLNSEYAKDKNNVYRLSEGVDGSVILKGIDPNNFELPEK